MRWKKYLTASDAALLVTGLTHHRTIEIARRSKFGIQPYFSPEQIKDGLKEKWEWEQELYEARVQEACDINDALIDEVIIVDPLAPADGINQPEDTVLEIAYRAETSDGYFDIDRTTLTRKSLASWFASLGDIEKAQKIIPDFEDTIIGNKQVETQPLRTPESTLRKSLGVMAMLLADSSPKYKVGGKPNMSQIAAAIEQKAAASAIDVENISNINKDISTCYKELTEPDNKA